MSTLRELQRSFQRHVLSGDPEVAAHVEQTRRISASTRLDVYSEGYRIRLRDALAATFPRLQEVLGAEAFDALARRYIDSHASRFASIRWFGDQLAAALREWRTEEPWLSELAEWEWALAAAFDAADAPALSADALSGVTPEEWPELRFEFHPSLQRLRLHTNAPTLYKELAESTLPSEPNLLDEPRRWILWRQDLKTRYRSLEPSDAATLDAMVEGGSFAALCELLCEWNTLEDVPLRAASLLKGWFADGLIVAANVGG